MKSQGIPLGARGPVSELDYLVSLPYFREDRHSKLAVLWIKIRALIYIPILVI